MNFCGACGTDNTPTAKTTEVAKGTPEAPESDKPETQPKVERSKSKFPKKTVPIAIAVIAIVAGLVLALVCFTTCSKVDYEDDTIVVNSSNLKTDEGLSTIHVSVENKSGSKQTILIKYDFFDESGETIASALVPITDLRPGAIYEDDSIIMATDSNGADIAANSIKTYKVDYAYHF